ncbi:hypothetical protein MTO96_013980 [Rhipicephalus appendiculatus]
MYTIGICWWVEQHHVTSSVNVPQLLEQAIVQFKTNTELFNDERYVGIWIRYAMVSPEPLATFKAMFETGIGDRYAEFYTTWAQQLEASGDTCGASRVLKGGIDRGAAPTSRLEGALRHLEARVSHQVALDLQQQCQEAALVGGSRQDAQSVLAPLCPQKQSTAPMTRSVPVARPAEQQQHGLAIVTAGSAAGNRGHMKVSVKSDENDPRDGDALLIQPVAAQHFMTATQLSKKNTRAAGKGPGASSRPGFEVPEEQGSQPPPPTPTLVPGCRLGLSERKKSAEVYDGFGWDLWGVPICRPDSTGLPVRPMYDKASVYRGTTEFQFEEIRLANIRARQRQILERQLQMLERQLEAERERCAQLEVERLVRQKRECEREDEVETLKREVLQMRKELQLLRSLLAKDRSGSRDHAVVPSQIVHLEQSILAAEQSILVAPTSSSSMEEGPCDQPDEVDMPPGTPSAHQASGAASAESTQSGGILRTADVSKVVRSLWNCTLGQSRLNEQDCTLQATPKNTVDEVPTETACQLQ